MIAQVAARRPRSFADRRSPSDLRSCDRVITRIMWPGLRPNGTAWPHRIAQTVPGRYNGIASETAHRPLTRMSVDEVQPRRPPRPPGDAKLVRYDEYIDKQIRTTQPHGEGGRFRHGDRGAGRRRARVSAHRGGRGALARAGRIQFRRAVPAVRAARGGRRLLRLSATLAAVRVGRSIRSTPPRRSSTAARRSRTVSSTCCCSASSAATSPTPSITRSKSKRPNG